MSSPSAKWVATDPATAISYLRTRINPNKAAGVTGKLAFNVDGTMAQLEIRNSIAEFSTNIAEDAVVLKVSGEKFGKYYAGELKAADIASGKALELLSNFDEYVQQTVPIRLMQTPTTCSVSRWKNLGNQGLMEL